MKWSYSSIKLYEQCQRKYFHLKVAKDVQEPESTAMLYGTEFHAAAENYIKSDTPLPSQFNYAKVALDNLKSIPGEKLCEYQMGLTRELEPCEFDAPDVWYRGIADLIIIDRAKRTARVVDYKTGKSAKYADKDQLELMALCVFKHFPEVQSVKGALLFVVANAMVKGQYRAEEQDLAWSRWVQRVHRVAVSHASDNWSPRPSGLCRKHCVVTSCPHNGQS